LLAIASVQSTRHWTMATASKLTPTDRGLKDYTENPATMAFKSVARRDRSWLAALV
jgi:hypothetical protein